MTEPVLPKRKYESLQNTSFFLGLVWLGLAVLHTILSDQWILFNILPANVLLFTTSLISFLVSFSAFHYGKKLQRESK